MEANAKASREYARSQVTLLLAETLAQEAHVKQLREYEQGFAQSALSALTQVNNLVGAYHFWFGASKELTQAEKDLAATTKLRDAMVKILGEDETKARKEALEAAEKAEKQAEREAAKEAAAEKRRLEALNLFNQELIKESVHYEKVWQAIEKADTKEQEKVFKNTEKALRDMGSAAYTVVLPAFQQLSAADRESLPTQREIFKVRQELVRLFPQMTAGEVQQRAQELATQPVIRQTISQTQNLRQAHQQLTAEIYQAVTGRQMFLSVSDQWRAALNAETLALNQNKVAAVENIAGGVAALIGGRRAQAAVEGAFDTAKAIEMWARFAASWGTDAGAALAAAQYTIAAAQMFQIAASGGGSAIPGGKLYNSSGGGGGLAAGTSATFGPPNALAPGAASALGKPATGVTIIFQGPVYGGKAGIRELATHLSDAVEQHDVRLVSLYTRRSVPVTGR